jgi:ubiquinone/menaquinone biosynthesis C-methylase UbiE
MNQYSKKKHLEEAEKYRDRIGDRLKNPEKVENDKKHLINDDIQRVNQVLQIPFGKKVLDIGCSDGAVIIEIAKKWDCDKAIGIDVSHSAINDAKNILSSFDPQIQERISFLESFIEDLDFPDNYFDTISACETLEHIGHGQLDRAMDNLVRMLKKDGNIVVTVPNRTPNEKYIKEKRDRWDWPTHYRHFTKKSLDEFLRKYFNKIYFLPLYDGEMPEESIYLICNCNEKI